MSPLPTFAPPAYGLTVNLPGQPYSEASPLVREALKAQGFGVLTEIDVAATMKQKLDADLPPYVILGACNPPLALQILGQEAAAGLMLPCNAIIADDGAGGSVVSFVDPVLLFGVVNNPNLEQSVGEIRARLERALEDIGGQQ